ncbi:hypothetical protein EG327_000251 [Venturia inaequalis]|uniref:Uncharacterized protein n=1 Tax=Venturia inaequalis TaxID=5025 RepID=A0A8H3VQW7_VENIN|nr:hypothetical protein EG327_000251 [Venturia inaequalis]
MEDFMAAVTGFKSKAPGLNVASPAKKAVVINLEDDDSDLEEVTRSPHWAAELQADRALSLYTATSALTHEATKKFKAHDDDSDIKTLPQSPQWQTESQVARPHAITSTLAYNATKPIKKPKTLVSKSKTQARRRIPWEWSDERTSVLYTPFYKNEWWSQMAPSGVPSVKAYTERYISHIGRIMETELGEELFGDARCTNCQRRNEECWVYSKEGSQQVLNPVRRCARCVQRDRDLGRGKGCVFVKG